MKKLIVITTDSMANGYRLAGVEAHGVETPSAAEDLIYGYLQSYEPILLAVDDELFTQLDPLLKKKIYLCKFIALVTIPGKSENVSTRMSQQHMFDMIRHATGVQIHFKGESNVSS